VVAGAGRAGPATVDGSSPHPTNRALRTAMPEHRTTRLEVDGPMPAA
jgi:hypothetical protein